MSARVRLLVGLAAVVVLAAGTVIVLVDDDFRQHAPASGTTAVQATDAAPGPAIDSTPSEAATVRADAAASATSADPRADLRARFARSSLRGAGRDGAIHLDAGHRVVADADLRRMFDWYLTLRGEFTPAEIRSLLLSDVEGERGGAVAHAVADLFDAYVAMHADLMAGSLSPDLAERLAQVRAAHRRWFGAAAESMFGDEEATLDYTVRRRALAQATDLDPAEREARLDALEKERPQAMRESEREATAAVLADEQSRQFEALGTDAAARHRERADLWGSEAADRLAALDRERAAWEQRLSDYARERDRIRADARLDATARERAITELQQRSFDANERLRVQALDGVLGD